MSFASANRATLLRVRETVWGTTPANPALIETRYTGESIDDNITFEKSKEIRADRQLTDTVLVDSSPSGSFNFEMSYGAFLDLIESSLMGTWSAALAIVGVAGDISTVAAATDNLSSTTAGKFTNIVVGQKILLSGFTTNSGENNGIYTVTAKTSNQLITIVPQPPSAETPAGTDAHVDGSLLRNGITERSYTLVKVLNDATTVTRHVFTGMRAKTMQLQFQTAQILTGSFGFTGKNALATESTFSGETITAADTSELLNSVTSLTDITQNNAALGSEGSVMQLSLELDNQHREQKGIGVLGNVGVVAGQLLINMSASLYFETKAQADMFKAATAFAFSFRLQDTDGNLLIVSLPRCKYEKFTFNASGLDTDVMAETTFTALRDPTTNCMIQIDRFPAA